MADVVDFENLDVTKIDKRTSLYKDYLKWQEQKEKEAAETETSEKEEPIPELINAPKDEEVEIEPVIPQEEEIEEQNGFEATENLAETDETNSLENFSAEEESPAKATETDEKPANRILMGNILELDFIPGDEVWIAEWCSERENRGFTSIVESYKYRPRKKTVVEVIISLEKILYKMNDKSLFEKDYVFRTYEESVVACNKNNP